MMDLDTIERLTERIRELEHTIASLRAAVTVHEAYGKRLGEDMTKLRSVAYYAVQIVAAYGANVERDTCDAIIRDLSEALQALEGE